MRGALFGGWARLRGAIVIGQSEGVDHHCAGRPQLVTDDAGPPIVLQPVVAEDGSGRWEGGGLTCPIGELRRRLGHRIR